MCGIAGYFAGTPRDEDAVARMLDVIRHRGPDDRSEYRFENYHVGMCRLAINDPARGQQPLYNRSRRVVVMYNGEIYNSPQLRSALEARGYEFRTGCDGEVICHLYDEYGEDVFGHLDGMFAIALWDENRRCLLLARDMAGEKPLHYAQIDAGKGVVFASEIKAIRRFDGLTLSLNRQALWDFPTFLWIPEPETVYTEVKALERGHLLKVDASSTTLSRYCCHLNLGPDSTLDDRQVVEETRRVVDRAIHSRLLSDVPIGSFLSGGLDSSIVATIATQALGNIDTFSVAFDKLADPYHGMADESEAAAAYARCLGSHHHTIHVTGTLFREALGRFCYYGDQPFAVSSGLGILAVAEAAHKAGIKVLLSGDCADECFGGYSWYFHLPVGATKQNNTFEQRPVSYQNFGLAENERLALMAGYSAQQRAWAWHYYAHEKEKAQLFPAEWREGLQSSLRHFAAFNGAAEWMPDCYIEQDRAFYLPNEMLRKLDRMTMAHSIEGRVPFAAPAVLAHAKRLSYSQMVRGTSLKWALRQAYADVLPADIVERPKHGFNVPIDHWLKGEWHDLLEATFSPSSMLHKLGMLNANAAQSAEQMLHDPERLNGHSLFCYIVLNRWLEEMPCQ